MSIFETILLCTALTVISFLLGKLIGGIRCAKLERTHLETPNMEVLRRLDEAERYAASFVDIMNQGVGGIGKRLAESLEIAEELQSRDPALFKEIEGLAYWLHANDQFLEQLYTASSPWLHSEQRRRAEGLKVINRQAVFTNIYVEAGLPITSFVRR